MGAFRILGEILGGSRKPPRSPRELSNGHSRVIGVEVARAPVLASVPSEQRLKMLEKVVAHYLESYKENARILCVMDEKAQRDIAFGVIAVAGVLALAAKSKGYELLGTVGYSGLTILCLALLAFLACAVAGTGVIGVRFVEGMLAPNALGRITEDLLDATMEPESLQVSIENWYRTQSTTWAGIIATQAKALMRKSRWLRRAQAMLLGGVVFLTSFALLLVTSVNLDLLPVWLRPLLPR